MSYFMIRSTYGYLQSGSRVAVAAPAADAVRRESGRAAHLAAVCCGRAVLASRGPWTPWTHVHQAGPALIDLTSLETVFIVIVILAVAIALRVPNIVKPHCDTNKKLIADS